MDNVENIITAVRADTNDSNTPYAVTDADLRRFLNWGNERIWGLILQTNPASMQKEVVIPTVANQREYALPADVYMGERIVNVEFKETGQDRDYYKLKETTYGYYTQHPANRPIAYIRRSGKILPTPPVDNSSMHFRVTYEAAPNKIVATGGTITAVTDSGTQVTAITIDIADDNIVGTSGTLCVTDPEGNSTMLNIPWTSYASGTGIFTMAAHTYTEGETIAIGYKVTEGDYTSNTSQLPTLCERYLTAYGVWKALSRTSAGNEKMNRFEKDLVDMEKEIVRSFQEPDKDEDEVGISNRELMFQEF